MIEVQYFKHERMQVYHPLQVVEIDDHKQVVGYPAYRGQLPANIGLPRLSWTTPG